MTVKNVYRNTADNYQCTIPMPYGEKRDQLFATGICFGFDPRWYPHGQRLIGKYNHLHQVLKDFEIEPYTEIELVPKE